MNLPTDVRNMIFEYCLVVKGCITPYKGVFTRVTDQDHTSHDFTVGLLAVNKVIRIEAAAIFYGKNVWRVTIQTSYVESDAEIELFNPPSGTDEDLTLIWSTHRALFRRVLIRADRYDIVGFDHRNTREWRSRINPNKPLAKRMEAAHSDNSELMHGCFGSPFKTVLEMPNLVSITFDVRNLLCLTGCCRIDPLQLFFALFKMFWHDSLSFGLGNSPINNLRTAYVTGIKSPLEEAQIVNTLGTPKIPWVVLKEDRRIKDDEDSDDSETESGEDSEDPEDPDDPDDRWETEAEEDNEDPDDE